MSKVCIIAWVYGRVQGVGFRYTTQHEAQTVGVDRLCEEYGGRQRRSCRLW